VALSTDVCLPDKSSREVFEGSSFQKLRKIISGRFRNQPKPILLCLCVVDHLQAVQSSTPGVWSAQCQHTFGDSIEEEIEKIYYNGREEGQPNRSDKSEEHRQAFGRWEIHKMLEKRTKAQALVDLEYSLTCFLVKRPWSSCKSRKSTSTLFLRHQHLWQKLV
jgi:hypothetical protein